LKGSAKSSRLKIEFSSAASGGADRSVRAPKTDMTPLEKLKLITAWTDDPALSEDELEDVLAESALPDEAGKHREEEGWSPTYDISFAAREAWLIKAARAAALVEVDPPESGIVTSRVFDNCMRIARFYQARRARTATIRN
jgi:hypothetical protein